MTTLSTSPSSTRHPLSTLATLTRVETALLMREPAAVLFTLALPLVLLASTAPAATARTPGSAALAPWTS